MMDSLLTTGKIPYYYEYLPITNGSSNNDEDGSQQETLLQSLPLLSSEVASSADKSNKNKNNKNSGSICYLENCHACGLPPYNENQQAQEQHVTESNHDNCKKEHEKLLACSKCHGVVYHNQSCQRKHWKQTHKKYCKQYTIILNQIKLLWPSSKPKSKPSSCPLQRFAKAMETSLFNQQWQIHIEQWYQQDYLIAMEGFQNALTPFMNEWGKYNTNSYGSCRYNDNHDNSNSNDSDTEYDGTTTASRLLTLAQRLLFCSYCEFDGQQINSGRTKLLYCLHILVSLLLLQCQQQEQDEQVGPTIRFNNNHELLVFCQTIHDAFQELVLVCEECNHDMFNARHVAYWAILCQRFWESSSNNNDARYKICDWIDPYQRPGYMAPITKPKQPVQDTLYFNNGYCPRDMHPSWCQILETNWERIRDEYCELVQQQQKQHSGLHQGGGQQQYFTKVGCGIRGSGHHDGSVINENSGGEWTEYVLFGAGANNSNGGGFCTFTKQLLLQLLDP